MGGACLESRTGQRFTEPYADFFARLILDLEHGGDSFLRNVGSYTD
jgi:hypothetical protein